MLSFLAFHFSVVSVWNSVLCSHEFHSSITTYKSKSKCVDYNLDCIVYREWCIICLLFLVQIAPWSLLFLGLERFIFILSYSLYKQLSLLTINTFLRCIYSEKCEYIGANQEHIKLNKSRERRVPCLIFQVGVRVWTRNPPVSRFLILHYYC